MSSSKLVGFRSEVLRFPRPKIRWDKRTEMPFTAGDGRVRFRFCAPPKVEVRSQGLARVVAIGRSWACAPLVLPRLVSAANARLDRRAQFLAARARAVGCSDPPADRRGDDLSAAAGLAAADRGRLRL